MECIRGDKEFTHGFYVNSLITGLITLSLLGLSLEDAGKMHTIGFSADLHRRSQGQAEPAG